MSAQQMINGAANSSQAREMVWLHALAQGVCAEGRAALKREVTFGQVLGAVADDLHRRLKNRGPSGDWLEWLQQAALVKDSEARRAADRVVSAVAADLPSILRAQLAVYLAGAPATVRQQLRRPADPTGTRVPVDLPVQEADDLLPFLPPRPPLYQPGDRPDGVGDWRLLELVGLSATSEVWKAKPFRDGNGAAVLKFCIDPSARDGRLFSEAGRVADLLAAEPQPGVITLREVYLDRMPSAVRYELVEGGGVPGLVQKWARYGGPAQIEQAARLLLSLAQTVAAMHRLDRGVVHGDLKPAHLLLQQPVHGGPLVLRVADYGLGRLQGELTRQASAREPDAPLARQQALRGAGSALYASPQLRQGGEPTTADDVYALGVIGLQMLCADLTMTPGPDWRERLGRIGVPLPLVLLLRSCLAEQADRRIGSDGLAEELALMLAPRVVATVPAMSADSGLVNPHVRKVIEAIERVQRLQERARKLEAANDVAAALHILEAIPERLRDNQLYNSLRERNGAEAPTDSVVSA